MPHARAKKGLLTIFILTLIKCELREQNGAKCLTSLENIYLKITDCSTDANVCKTG